jgi:hypothetical protein
VNRLTVDAPKMQEREHAMKQVEAIIKPFKLDEVKESLNRIGACEA